MTPDEKQDWTPFLKRVPLFRDLSAEDLAKFAALLKPLSLPRGAALFRQGDKTEAFYLVTSGRVRLTIEAQGRRRILAYVGAGEALGETQLLTGEPSGFSAELDTTTEFLVLAQADFAAMVRETPALLVQMARTLSARFLEQTREREPGAAELQPQVLCLVDALEAADRTLFTLALGHALSEQTRRRVLLVDLRGDAGTLARALGLTPLLVTEAMLREEDLHHPTLVERIAQPHPSGISVLSLEPATLGGRLHRSIFLLVNMLRGAYDFVVIALEPSFGDVERSVLYEADTWLSVGCAGRKGLFEDVEARLRAFQPEPRAIHSLWLGSEAPPDVLLAPGRDFTRVPWTGAAADAFRGGEAPFTALMRAPKSLVCVERLARRLGRLRVGLALGTGAALGLSLIGILKAFKREHIPIDILAGTSMGSLIGGLYALGLEPEEIEGIATRIDKAWVYENLFWDLTVPRAGLFAGATLMRFLRSYFGAREFHELGLPFACVATDIETGEGVVFRDGRIAEAIRSSCGIPLVYQPYHYRGRFLVDGGLVDPVPVGVLSQMGADVLVAVNLTMPAGERKTGLREQRHARSDLALELEKLKGALPDALKGPNLRQIFFQMIYTMEYEIARSRDQLAHVTIHPDLSGFSWTEMHQAKRLIDAGERVAENVVPKIKSMLPVFSDHCRVRLRPRPLQP